MNRNSICVVCPIYNSSSYLADLLYTLESQTEIPDEIIFIDDGSTDGSDKLIYDYLLNSVLAPVSRIYQIKHLGPGAARNHGICKANSDWIAFIDSDDRWNENKIGILKKSINQNPGYDIFLNWENYYKLNGDVILLNHGYWWTSSLSKDFILRKLYKTNYMSTSAVTIRKDAVIERGIFFDENMANGQDYDYWLKILSFMRIFVIPTVLGDYVERVGNITSRPYRKKIINELKICIRYKKYGTHTDFIIKILRIFFTLQWVR